jgi:hypothetical protein
VTGDDRFGAARQVADAVLYEGYVLYPYRASAKKNQLRWQFGVLAPPAAAPAEASSMQTEVIVDARAGARLDVRIRCLQVQARVVEDAAAGFAPVATLDTGDRLWTSFDEAVEHEIDIPEVALDELVASERRVPVELAAGHEVEDLVGADGTVLGRVVRRRWPVSAAVTLRAAWCDGPYPLARVTVTIENRTEVAAAQPRGSAEAALGTGRDAAVRQSLVAVHTLAAVDCGSFVSALDPPRFAAEAVAACRNTGTFPVLIEDDVVLSSPIILYDRPAIAPESEGDMFDGCEIDEILALRVLTLTDEEKREARSTDPRSAAVVDRIDAMSPGSFEALHGTFRSIRTADPPWADSAEGGGFRVPDRPVDTPELPWWEPAVDAGFDPWSDTVWVGPVEVGKGARVKLCPSRRADAQDLFISGLSATVAGVFHDVDDDVHLAVVVDDDPAAELHQWHGRYLYFRPEEVEVLEP